MKESEIDDSKHPARGGHPLQPLYRDALGVVRFKPNKIVLALLEHGTRSGMDLNRIAAMFFPQEDQEQLAQLIGYSVSGFAELPYVSDAAYAEARDLAEKL